MDVVFTIILTFLCIYAIVTVATVVKDFSTGRYKRLRSLRNEMDEADIELRRRRASSKILETHSND